MQAQVALSMLWELQLRVPGERRARTAHTRKPTRQRAVSRCGAMGYAAHTRCARGWARAHAPTRVTRLHVRGARAAFATAPYAYASTGMTIIFLELFLGVPMMRLALRATK
eukprot:1518739-Prymnesium_polylepis.1